MQPLRLLLPLLSVSLCAAACSPPEPETAEAEPAAEARLATLVETVALETTSFNERIELTGETLPIRTAVISSQIAGRITRFDVTEGAYVEEGARVLRVDTGTASSQRAQLDTQRDALDRDIRRAESLLGRGIGTRTDFEALEVQRELLTEQMNSIDISIRQGRGETPISGTVVETMAEVGEFTSPGQPLARIVDVSSIEVRVGLPEREIRFVREGMTVPVRILATQTEHMGVLHRIGVQADAASRTFPLVIRIDNNEGTLRAGMRAQVTLTKRDLDDAVVIPRDAVLQGLEGPEVLIDVNGVVEARTVVLGPGRGGFTVVESGVGPGDRLIVRGHRLLVPGEPIRTVDQGICCASQFDRYLNGTPAAEAPTDQLGG